VQESGIRCPRCSERALDPGDWAHIHSLQRPGGVVEEAVCCWNCNAFLLASPDDDVDPVRSGESYDPRIYHRFVRPPGWTPPTQETLDRPPRPDDWIVVVKSHRLDKRDLLNAEGLVLEVTEHNVTFRPAGFCGLQRDRSEVVPIEKVRVMVFQTYRAGMRVRVTRGEHRGLEGRITDLRGANITVESNDGTTLTTIQEHVHRLDKE